MFMHVCACRERGQEGRQNKLGYQKVHRPNNIVGKDVCVFVCSRAYACREWGQEGRENKLGYLKVR